MDANVRRVLQALRYKLALLQRRVEQQGAERSVTILHRAINRRFQVLDDKTARLKEALRRTLTARTIQRNMLDARLRYMDVRPRLERDRNRLNGAHALIASVMQRASAARRKRLETGVARLEQLSPLRVLDRGYAIVRQKNGGILKDPATVQHGTALEIRLAAGILEAESK
jgi:exodeoxyribonuclease VII large subunit